jgi:hypothetical protein
MARFAYDGLSFLDRSFLLAASPHAPMHVGSAASFEAGPLARADGGVDTDQVREYVASRQHPDCGQVPLTDHLGLGIALFSYAGKLCWGYTADWGLLPDLHDVGTVTEAAFEDLCAAARIP